MTDVRIVVDQRSVELITRNMRRFVNETTPRAERRALVAAGKVVERAVRANVSIPPIGGTEGAHEAALRDLDHPYAKRHPGIQIAPSGGTIRNRRLLVHTVSGALLGALRTQVAGEELTIGFDPRKAPHAEFVVNGTQVMHPRDVVHATATEPAIRAQARRALVDTLSRAMGF